MKLKSNFLSIFAVFALSMAATSAWARQVSLNDDGYINMPKDHTTDTLVIPDGVTEFKVYDDGGPSATFTSYCDGNLLLTAPEGHLLRVSGRLHTSLGSINTGHLYVYDGASADANQFYSKTGVVDNLPRKLSSTQNMFISFRGNISQKGYDGLELTITVVDPNEPHAINIKTAEHGSIINAPIDAAPGTLVTLMVNPDNGYVLSNAIVQDEYGLDGYGSNVEYNASWYSNNEISFIMPQTEVTVTPAFENGAYGDFELPIMQSGTKNIYIPDGLKKFEISVGYGDENIDSYIGLNAPKGKVLHTVFEFPGRSSSDSLYIYDGSDTLLSASQGIYVERLTSSGTALNVHYKEIAELNGWAGLYLFVLVVDPDEKFDINISKEFSDGSIDNSTYSAKVNTPVTLTAVPDEEYFLNKIEVRGSDTYAPVALNGGTWYTNNEATFDMPGENVFVSASFVSELTADAGLSITMPVTEPLRVTVPNGVQSFEIEGEDIGYNRASQPLILTAPEGYLFQLEGYVNESDFGMGFNAYQGEFVNPVGSNAQLMSGETMTKKMTLVHVASGDGPSFMRVRLVSEWETGIKIPKSGSVTMNIPEGIEAFIVYDDGGDYGDYSNNSDGSLTLTAPEGYGLMVGGGTYVADTGDSLIVYDGINTSAAVIAKASLNQSAWTLSSGRSMTLRFKSNDDGKAYGLELSVMVVKSSASFAAVSVYEGEDNSKIAAVYGDYSGKKKVNIPHSIDVDYIAYIREFTPNVPSTIVLPFSLPEGAETNGKFYYLKEVAQVKGEYKWKATFRNITLDKASALPAANTPYAVIVDDEELWFGFEDSQATLQTSEIAKQNDNTGKWIFEGSYEYKTWESDDPELGLAYALAAEDDPDGAYTAGQYVKIGAGSYATPMRAYMSKINSSVRLSRPLAWGETSYISSMELPESIDVEFIDAEEKPMAVGRMNTVTGEFKIDRWYDLKGRSTNKKPTTKGAFYNKRVIVK